MIEINTNYPARIKEFFPETQTATVQLMLEVFFSTLDEDYVVQDSPLLLDVPCHFPRGGDYSVTLPVAVGDDCIVNFAQKGIEHWLYEGLDRAGSLGDNPSPQHMRKFSKSDAWALIGFGAGILADKPRTIEKFNPNNVEIRNKDRTQRLSLLPNGDVELLVPKDLVAMVEGNVTATVKGDVTANVDGAMTANVKGNTTLKSPKIVLDGEVTVTGEAKFAKSISVSAAASVGGTVSASSVSASTIKTTDGKDLSTHTHPSDGAPPS